MWLIHCAQYSPRLTYFFQWSQQFNLLCWKAHLALLVTAWWLAVACEVWRNIIFLNRLLYHKYFITEKRESFNLFLKITCMYVSCCSFGWRVELLNLCIFSEIISEICDTLYYITVFVAVNICKSLCTYYSYNLRWCRVYEKKLSFQISGHYKSKIVYEKYNIIWTLYYCSIPMTITMNEYIEYPLNNVKKILVSLKIQLYESSFLFFFSNISSLLLCALRMGVWMPCVYRSDLFTEIDEINSKTKP